MVVWMVAAAYRAFLAIITSFVRYANATVISFLLIFITYTSGVPSTADDTPAYLLSERQGNNDTMCRVP